MVSSYPPKSLVPPSSKTVHQTQNFQRCKNVLEVYAKTSHATGETKMLSFCLSVCLFVHHSLERQSLRERFCPEAVGT